ncbi:hypothetical protein ACHAXT_011011 [Thalassiosira profunda]
MPETAETVGGGGGGGGRTSSPGRGASPGRGKWAAVRGRVRSGSTSSASSADQATTRRPKLLTTMKRTSFRFSGRHIQRGEADIPEEGGDLHKHFKTCASLTRIREEFRNALGEDAERHLGFGLNVCARPQEETGRLLLHSIGLNAELIAHGGGGTAVAQSRVNQFIFQELLPAYPSAIIEVDDKGCIPFVEPIVQWIEARRAIRKWKLDTDRSRQKVALVAAKLRRSITVAAAKHEYIPDSDSEDGKRPSPRRELKKPASSRSMSRFGAFLAGGSAMEKQARMELKMIVDSADDAMFCIDEKGKILLTNQAAMKKFGYSRRELTGANISVICNANDAPNHHKYLERYIKTGEKRVMGKKRELLARKKDGSTFTIELGLTEVKLGGGKFIFCGFCKDMTELKSHRRSLELGEGASESFDKGGENEGVQNKQARGIPPLVEWCLTILSEFVDHHGGLRDHGGTGRNDDDESSMDNSTDLTASFSSLKGFNQESSPITMRDTMVVEKVAAIPNLLEELLLVDDPEARSRVFDMSIVHKVLFTAESLGDGEWLIRMLDKSIRVQKQKVLDANLTGADLDTAEGRAYQLQVAMAQEECRFLAEAAIFYLERVSELNIQDDLFVFHHLQMEAAVAQGGEVADMISTGDVHHFQMHRNSLFDAVGGLNGLIRRISVLEDDLVKRAAATQVVRRLLDKIMFSPFATLAALFDGINHLLLIICFRVGPAPALFHLAKNDSTFATQQYLISSATLMSSVAYFGTKSVHQNMAKYALSENLFWSDLWTFWSFLDIFPLMMVLFCSVAVDFVLYQRARADVGDSDIPFLLRTAIAITTPFLWLRIMAFVKVRNKQLATFILCTVEIMKDIKWFLLVLFAAMASFAQMWVSFTFEPSHLESSYIMEGYMKAYTMMLGDLDADALRTHPLIAVLFVVYTFGVTIVLLNILIAIVSDSYQNSFVSSKMMLGKARVMFCSELLSIKTFHHMWMAGKTGNMRARVNYLFAGVALFHLMMITGTVNEKMRQQSLCLEDGGLFHPGTVKLEAALVFTFLFGMLFAEKKIIAYVLEEFNDTGGLKHSLEGKPSSRIQSAVNWFVKHAFSALSSSFDSLFDREDTLNALGNSPGAHHENREEKALQRSIDKTRKQLKSEFKGMFNQLQLSLTEMEAQNKADMSKIEAHISKAIASSIQETQQLMVQAAQLPQSFDFAPSSQHQVAQQQIVRDDASSEGSHSSLSMDGIIGSLPASSIERPGDKFHQVVLEATKSREESN